MMYTEPEKTAEEKEIGFLRELLPKVNGECLAYIKGAVEALLYAQEEPQEMAVVHGVADAKIPQRSVLVDHAGYS